MTEPSSLKILLRGTTEPFIEGALAGDRKSQKAIYEALLPYLRGTIRRYSYTQAFEQDILQETFLRIFKYLNTYERTKGTLQSWAARIAINTSISFGVKYNTQAHKDIADLSSEPSVSPSVLGDLAAEELLIELKKMPSEFYLVFSLHCIDGFSHQEIASQLKISENLSRKRLSRARQWIQSRLLSMKEIVLTTKMKP